MPTDYIISASVGRGGVNKPDDVIVIQILLNRIPATDGGPDPQLDADGLIGPKTLAAIDGFQQHHQLGSDGRIDPGGKMLAALQRAVASAIVSSPAPEVLALPDPGRPIEPGYGGRSIGISELKPGDLIATASGTRASNVIQWATNSKVSHVMLYLGADELDYSRVADAVPIRGVSYRYLAGPNRELLSPDNDDYAFGDVVRAVVFRSQPNLTTQQVTAIQAFADTQIGHGYDYLIGRVEQPAFHLDADVWCAPLALLNNSLGAKCQEWVGRVNLWLGEVEQAQERFFCSEFVLKAYASAGISLVDREPEQALPQDIVELSWTGRLGYVGHLI